MKAPEILSPAGSFESLKAAVENGADAVYLGGKEFNARRGASNFTRDELKRALEYAHLKGVNVYVTVNILLSDGEIEQAGDFIDFLCSIGADGVIVQDLGLGHFIKENFKNLELHASTQMTIHNTAGAEVLKKMNFDRVVLARELSLEEIKEIKTKTGLKVETFVHGALCFCYSGQCLMSSFIGGRSGNRGQCAQPCRLPYTLVDRKGKFLTPKLHLLSPRDLNMIEYLPKLIEAGIDSFKIEGRLKRPEYVAAVTAMYRRAIENFLEGSDKFQIDPEDKKKLAQIFNRDFTTGYYFGNPGSELMSVDYPRNKGIFLGKVIGLNAETGMAKISLKETLRAGDGIDFRGKESFGCTVTNFFINGKAVKESEPGKIVEIKTEKAIKKGTPVYKTSDIKLINELKESYENPKCEKKIYIDVQVTAKKGEPLTIMACDEDGFVSRQESSFIIQEAKKRPLDKKILKDQIDRLGGTIFKIRNFNVHMDENVMVPFSAINELRRTTIKDLENQRKKAHVKPVSNKDWREDLKKMFDSRKPASGSSSKLKLSVLISDIEAVEASISAGADIIYFAGDIFGSAFSLYLKAFRMAINNKREFFLVLPRIVKNDSMKILYSSLKNFKNQGIAGVVAGNLGILSEAKKLGLDVISDFSLNAFNSLSLSVLEKLGAKRVILSTELTLNQIRKLKSDVEKECIVHGHIPLMVSEHNLIKSNLKEDKEVFGLRDRIGKIFPIRIDESGRTHIFNGDELCMINYLEEIKDSGISVVQLYLPYQSPERVKELTSAYKNAIDKSLKIDESKLASNFTHGHFFRKVM